MKKIKVDNKKIKYIEKGKEHAEKLLLVHTLGSNGKYYKKFIDYLDDDFHILVPDLPGYGKSDTFEDKSHSLKNYSEFLFKFVEKFDFDTFHFVGSSLGALIGIVFSADHPELIKRQVFHAPPWTSSALNYKQIYKVLQERLVNERLVSLASKVKTKVDGRVLSKMIRIIFKDIADVESENGLISDFIRNIDLQAAADMWFEIKYLNLRPQAKNIKNPTLIVSSENDKTVKPLEVLKLTNVIKNSKFKFIEGEEMVHPLFLKCPKKLAEIISNFLLEKK